MTPEDSVPRASASGRAGLVLCGGGSRRMGRDKASLPFGDETLLARVVRLLAAEVDEIWLVAREGQVLPPVGPGVGIARDPAEGLGPLAGVIAGLRAMRAERAFVTTCDAPLLAPGFAAQLFALSEGCDAAIPRVDDYLVPTTAVYARAILPAAEALLARGELRPRMLTAEPNVRVVDDLALRAVDPDLLSLRDCDTPDEYRALLLLAGLDPEPSRMLGKP